MKVLVLGAGVIGTTCAYPRFGPKRSRQVNMKRNPGIGSLQLVSIIGFVDRIPTNEFHIDIALNEIEMNGR